MSDCKRVYRFGTDAQGTCVTEGDKSMNFVLGGKGANLAEMSRIGLPVPGGFTITCQTCVEYSGAGNVWPEGALDEIVAAEADLEARCGKKLGDASDPLLVSVRSGAPFSMPGMMDTVLNLGLNDDSVQGLIAQTQNPRFAWDSYRRFIQMFSNVVMGVDSDLFENALTQAAWLPVFASIPSFQPRTCRSSSRLSRAFTQTTLRPLCTPSSRSRTASPSSRAIRSSSCALPFRPSLAAG